MRPARCHLQGSGPHKAVKYRLLRNESERKKNNKLTDQEGENLKHVGAVLWQGCQICCKCGQSCQRKLFGYFQKLSLLATRWFVFPHVKGSNFCESED